MAEDTSDEAIIKSLIEIKQKGEEMFEKNITLLAGGTLLISLTFIEKIVNVNISVAKWVLICSWIVLAISLLLNLLSHQISSILHGKTIDDYRSANANTLSNITQRNKVIIRVNWWTSGCLILGIAFLILFCSLNLYVMPQEKQPIQRPTNPDQTKGWPISVPRGPQQQPTTQPTTTPQQPSNPQPTQPTPSR